MSPKSPNVLMKVLIITGFILSLAATAAAGYLFYTHRQDSVQLRELEALKVQLQDQVQTLQGEAASYEKQKMQFMEKIDGLDDQLVLEKKKAIGQLEELKTAQSEINTMRKEITALSEKIELFKKAEQLKLQAEESLGEGREYPEEEVQSAIRRATSLVTEPFKALIPGSSEKPSAEPQTSKTAVVESVPFVSSSSPDDPRIKTINRSFNFVVVNFGSDQGLSMGDQLVVNRNGKEIGRVEVQKLYDRFASAKIISESSANVIHEGDPVRKI